MKYGTVIDLFVRALRHAGVEVDHRVVDPEESLDDYDALWLGISPLHSMSSRYHFGALDALVRAKKMGLPRVYWIDDWQTHLLEAGYKTLLKTPTRMIKDDKLHDTRYAIDWAREKPEHLDITIEGMKILRHDPWPLTFAPFYTWGDHMSVFKSLPQITSENLVTVDPSMYADAYEIRPLPDNQRDRQWVLGILSNQLEWAATLRTQWPLDLIGGRASRAEQKMKESELIQHYSEKWGVLSPPYWHIGSGWWRNRFVYSAYAGCIIAGDPREGAPCSAAYTYPPEAVEDWSNEQLRQLADWQKRDLVSQMMTRAEVQETLKSTFEKAIKEGA
jgi:hypothetical protein